MYLPTGVADGGVELLTLSHKQLAQLREAGRKALHEALAKSSAYQAARSTYLAHCPPWKLHAEHGRLSAYQRSVGGGSTASVSQIFGTVDGNYRDLVQFFKSESRDEYLDVQKKLFHATADAAVLCNIPQRRGGSALAYEGVKWASYEPFMTRLRMDSCHFEMAGEGTDASGRPYAYRVVVPVELGDAPGLFQRKRSVRVASTSVTISWPCDAIAKQSSDLFVLMHNDLKATRVSRAMHKQLLKSLHKIDSHRRRACAVCSRAFSLLRAKRHCTVCDESVCRKCIVKGSELTVVKRSSGGGHHRLSATTRMCICCIKDMREEEQRVTLEMPAETLTGQCRTSDASTHVTTSMDSASVCSAIDSRSRAPSELGWASTPPPRLGSARARFASSGSTFSSCTSQPTTRGEEECDAILEEELPLGRSGVLFTVDTSDMERVFPRSADLHPPRESRSSDEMMQNIGLALQEQQILLQHLKHRARRSATSL